jgi:23S rRNA pseudouridine1911/1915/1917 synthase
MGNRFHILSDEEGTRIDVFLAQHLSITRTKIKEMFEQGRVRVVGRVPKASLKVRKGMDIEGEIPEEPPLTLIPQNIPLEILYEDSYILAINKPNGMVVHPSFGHMEGTLVNAILSYLGKGGQTAGGWKIATEEEAQRGPEEVSVLPNSKLETQNWASSARPGVVHRLDKGTTGVILVAKDPKTQIMLSALFKERAVEKTYRAVVEGTMRREGGSMEGNIGRHPTNRKRMAVLTAEGRTALTRFTVLRRLKGYTYLEAYPKTGRTHQIRVHLSHAGHPIVGDEAYGRNAKHETDRPLLHAYSIAFNHPRHGGPVKIVAPLPEDMIQFIEAHEMGRNHNQ